MMYCADAPGVSLRFFDPFLLAKQYVQHAC
jgi:hypothetical protein